MGPLALVWSNIGGGTLERLLYFAIRAAWEVHEALCFSSARYFRVRYLVACITKARYFTPTAITASDAALHTFRGVGGYSREAWWRYLIGSYELRVDLGFRACRVDHAFFSYSFSSLVFSLTTAVASGGHQVSGEASVEARGYP